MCWNAKYVLLLLFSTTVTYLSGLLLQVVKEKRMDSTTETKLKNMIVMLSFLINLTVLFYFKYFNFMLDTVQYLCVKLDIALNIPRQDILLPVGISFFTFQALSYTMDVYRNEIYAEKNFVISCFFFPQLVAGPIETVYIFVEVVLGYNSLQ